MVRHNLWFLYRKLQMHSNDFLYIQLSDLVYAHLKLILFCHCSEVYIKEFSKVTPFTIAQLEKILDM
jgi:hypothetical protein